MPAIAGTALSRSFEPEVAVRTAIERLGSTPACIVAFLGRRGSIEQAAIRVASATQNVPTLLVECGGVVESEGESEGDGVAAMAWGRSGIDVTLHSLAGDPAAATATARSHGTGAALLGLFLTPPLYGPGVPHGLGSADLADTAIVGGGARKTLLLADGKTSTPVDGAALVIRSRELRVAMQTTPAARLLTEFRTLDDVHGNFLLTADGEPVMEWLQKSPGPRAEGNPMFVAVQAKDATAPPLLRSVAGMDPRRGVAVSEPIEKGARIALAAWDGDAARHDLELRAAVLGRSMEGGSPVAALLVTCVGRGTDLFGAPDVDVRALRGHVGDVPIAGMFSQFEIARFDGAPRVHLYTAAMAVLYRPS